MSKKAYFKALEAYTANLIVRVTELTQELEKTELKNRYTMEAVHEVYKKRIEALKEGDPYDIDGGKRKLI